MTQDNSLGTLGRYKIIEEIGRGGFSIVYRAENVALKKIVAVKMMLPALFHSPENVEQFIKEAHTVAAMQHENIVRVVDLDQDEGRLFMAMEYLPGGDLHAWVKGQGQPAFSKAAQICADIASALDHAHQQGIIHGDVKPGNILLTQDGRAKLTDFGVLRAVESSGVTSADMTRGTPYYISPEQAEGQRASPQSDQYALGVVAYELLAGRLPFEGETPMAIYLKHIREKPPSLAEFNAIVTPELETVVNRTLAKDPQERYPTCEDFAQALRNAIAVTQEEQFQSLVAEAQAALDDHSLDVARARLGEALQIMPEEDQAKSLLSELERQEQAQRAYRDASESLSAAQRGATSLRHSHPQHSDPEGLLSQLAPPNPPAWKVLLKRWRGGFYLALGLFVFGLVLALGYTGYLEIGSQQGIPKATQKKATLVAVVRSSTPTPTFTPTYTPTPTFTPTYTLTYTPTPTFTSTFTPTPTLTPTHAPGDTMLSPKDGMTLIYVPAGEFEMGSEAEEGLAACRELYEPFSDRECERGWYEDEEPRHNVYLDAFWIDKTEVTNAQFATFLKDQGNQSEGGETWLDTDDDDVQIGQNGSQWQPQSGYEDHPVIEVTWYGAQAYCAWAGRRLPTEAEWEKAARGENGLTYPWGNTFDGDYVNFCDSDCKFDWANPNYDDGYADTAPVGTYPTGASSYGALDMAGNVWEWVADWYDVYPGGDSSASDYFGQERRVLRGGSWVNRGTQRPGR